MYVACKEQLCALCGKPVGEPVPNAEMYHMECLMKEVNKVEIKDEV